MTVLVTGAAGFIGSYVVKALVGRGEKVVGIDNLNDYYAPGLKKARLKNLPDHGFEFHKIDIADHDTFMAITKQTKPEAIIHLAAQAGVRYSLEKPFAYNHSNLQGHLSVLEVVRHCEIKHLVYASSSSIYGANKTIPFKEDHQADKPVSLYGATKKSNELMSESYARLYNIPQTGLRFFTVYGPWGRPDMAYWIFTEKMLKGEPIQIFNHGKMGRDFTYIDDIVSGVLAAYDHPPGAEKNFHAIYNLGNDHPEELMTMVSLLETALGVEAKKEMRGMQDGDVERTWADISKARKELGYQPSTSLADGIARFVKWRRSLPSGFD